jgi:hypothetical protein
MVPKGMGQVLLAGMGTVAFVFVPTILFVGALARTVNLMGMPSRIQVCVLALVDRLSR